MFGLLALFLFRGEGWNATAFAIFAAVGLIFPALVTFLNFTSNRRAGPTLAGTVSSTTPFFAVLGAILFLGEPLNPAVAAGTAAIVLGVVALTARGGNRPQTWAAWVILGKRLRCGKPSCAETQPRGTWEKPKERFQAARPSHSASRGAQRNPQECR
jgi:drug/metabolite transporter (DMT)-like permease